MTIQPRVELSSGNFMPAMGLGSWQLDTDTAGTVEYALDLGYRLIDTSSDYGSQPGIGKAIGRSSVGRPELYVTTKVEEHDDAYERTCRNLEDLGLDCVELVLIHRPPPSGAGEALWEGLMRARDEGLTRDIGVSNYSSSLIDRLTEATGTAPAVNQIEWSPFGHSAAMREYARSHEMVIQAYSPLTRQTRLDDARLRQIAAKYGKTPAQIMIRWSMQSGQVPIPKANRKEHLEENIAVLDFEIEDEDMARLWELDENYSALGSLPYS